MYCETQRGGLCRLHSLNAYFEYNKISDITFTEYKKEYDEYYRIKYGINTSCDNYDIINSDQTTIVSFILKKYGIYTKLFAINSLYNKEASNILNILSGNFFFIYNNNHIFGIRCKNGIWYTIDSLCGVKVLSNISNISTMKNVGFIVPVNMRSELYRNLDILKHNITVNPSIYLISVFNEKKLLGEIEVPLNLIMDILQTNYNIIDISIKNKFIPIKKNIEMYNLFLIEFSKKKSIDIILNYIPGILKNLLKLNNLDNN
jgi:hypothetical protein